MLSGSGAQGTYKFYKGRRHGASGGFKGGLMMCWVLGLFWRGFIGWQMLARVQETGGWWTFFFASEREHVHRLIYN